MSKEKKYLIPTADIVEFLSRDIITTSGEDEWWSSGEVGQVDDNDIP